MKKNVLARAVVSALWIPAAWAAEPLPQSPAQLMQDRAPAGRGVDLFGVIRPSSPPPLAPATARRAAPVPEAASPAPPSPPPLSFTYGGSGLVNGRRVLFLERDNRSLLVEVGDIVEGTYRVEALERNRAVLRYLPMNIAQVMLFGSPEVTSPAPAAARQRLQGPLIVDVPDEVPLNREAAVVLGIPNGSVAAKATVQLNYDENALSVIGAKIVRPGRAVVEMSQDGTPSKELRLKPLSTEVSSTEIAIHVMAFDAKGQSLAVRLPPHLISLVEAAN